MLACGSYMTSVIRIPLRPTADQAARLAALQQAFAAVCNQLAPLVQRTRCWNRVALHHMAYKQLRQQFPDLGSQLVCNAIYSVSRACRLIFQHPHSPFNLQRLGPAPLPNLQFLPQSPVYFDRHTLSIKSGQVSMYTLDGRMRFQLDLSEDHELRFKTEKLREIALRSRATSYELVFHFAEASDNPTDPPDLDGELPEYVLVQTHELLPPSGRPDADAIGLST